MLVLSCACFVIIINIYVDVMQYITVLEILCYIVTFGSY